MLTIFSIPKPFRDKISQIQRNAIRSWLHANPGCEILLFGDEEGTQEVAQEYGLQHISDIKKNAYGTPTLDSVFDQAQKIAKYDTICYVNCDIIFPEGIHSIIDKLQFRPFLLVGRRINVDINDALNFDGDGMQDVLQAAQTRGVLESEMGIDFFIFPQGSIGPIPEFAVGRKGWDNWFIYNARLKEIPVIDCTPSFMAIHQNHGYHHVQQQSGSKWEGPESDTNMELIKNPLFLWDLNDANWVLTDKGVIRTPFSLLKVYRSLILYSPTFLLPAIGEIATLIVRARRRMSISHRN